MASKKKNYKLSVKQKILNEILSLFKLSDKNLYSSLDYKKYINKLKINYDDYCKHIYRLHRAIIHLNIEYKEIQCPSGEFPDFCIIDNSGFKHFIEVTDEVYGDKPECTQIDDISYRINHKFKKYTNKTDNSSTEQVKSKILVIEDTRYSVLDYYDDQTKTKDFKNLLLNSCDDLKKKHDYFDHVLVICQTLTVTLNPPIEIREPFNKFWLLKYSTEENKWVYLN